MVVSLYNDNTFHLSYDIGRWEVWVLDIEKKLKINNIISVVLIVMMTFSYIRLVLREGITQVGYLSTGLYVFAVGITIFGWFYQWRTNQIIKSSQSHV